MSELLRLAAGQPGVHLRELTEPDDRLLLDAVNEDRDHLSRHGNRIAEHYRDIEQAAEWREAAGDTLMMGIWDRSMLAGVAVAIPRSDYREVEIGYWLRKSATGRGLATLAVRTLTGHAAADYPVFAEVHVDNTASIAVLERCGYHYNHPVKKPWGRGFRYDYAAVRR